MSIDTTDALTPSPTALLSGALTSLFEGAHTTEWFTDEPVELTQIEQAYEQLRWAPTAMNTSPLRLAILPPGPARDDLIPLMGENNRAKTAAAPVTLIAAADPRFHDHLGVLAPFREGLADRLEGEPERRLEMATSNARIQIGYLILALRGLGLAVGPMGGFDRAGVDARFFAGSGWRSLLVLNVGHEARPDGIRPRQGRLSADQAVVVL